MNRVAHLHVGRIVPAVALIVGLLTVMSIGCRRGVPVVDASNPVEAFGTISGTVRGPQGARAIDRRPVDVVNVATGARQRVTTNNAGGFTIKVSPGKYRVQVSLRDGESIIKQPGVIHVNRSDIGGHADIVIGSVRIAGPRSRTSQPDPGLGPPIA